MNDTICYACGKCAVTRLVPWVNRGVCARCRDNIKLVEELEDDSCPRCGGDHAWCQWVQPGEFGEESVDRREK